MTNLNSVQITGKNLRTLQAASRLLFLALVFIVSVNSASAQTVPPNAPPPPEALPRPPYPPTSNRRGVVKIKNNSGAPAEKSIAADAKVNVKICVAEGRLKIYGWDRREIRAFVGEGSAVGFKILQKSKQTTVPVWVEVLGFDPAKNKEPNPDECLSGDTIEIDVPRGATVTVTSRQSETIVDSVAKVSVENLGGDILLRNIAHGINAKTFEGDVSVEKSAGAITLFATTGDIIASDVAPSEIGDVFRAKTSSGAIVLQQTEHRQIEASSHSGAIKFAGALLSGGQYNFTAFNGSINLSIPPDSSSKINASYGFGTFKSDIALQNSVKPPASNAQNLSAQIGAGEAALNLSTYSGAIHIKKQ